jgi:hypothetical protein
MEKASSKCESCSCKQCKKNIEIIRNRNDRFFTLGGPARVMLDFAKTYVEVQKGKNSIATYLRTHL